MSLYKKYAESYRLPVECLIRARRNGRMASSYLLYSDSPRVRDEFSLVIAMIAACRAPENGAPCEKCDVCRLLENGNALAERFVRGEHKEGWVRMCDSQGGFKGIYQWDEVKKRYQPQKMFL